MADNSKVKISNNLISLAKPDSGDITPEKGEKIKRRIITDLIAQVQQNPEIVFINQDKGFLYPFVEIINNTKSFCQENGPLTLKKDDNHFLYLYHQDDTEKQKPLLVYDQSLLFFTQYQYNQYSNPEYSEIIYSTEKQYQIGILAQPANLKGRTIPKNEVIHFDIERTFTDELRKQKTVATRFLYQKEENSIPCFTKFWIVRIYQIQPNEEEKLIDVHAIFNDPGEITLKDDLPEIDIKTPGNVVLNPEGEEVIEEFESALQEAEAELKTPVDEFKDILHKFTPKNFSQQFEKFMQHLKKIEEFLDKKFGTEKLMCIKKLLEIYDIYDFDGDVNGQIFSKNINDISRMKNKLKLMMKDQTKNGLQEEIISASTNEEKINAAANFIENAKEYKEIKDLFGASFPDILDISGMNLAKDVLSDYIFENLDKNDDEINRFLNAYNPQYGDMFFGLPIYNQKGVVSEIQKKVINTIETEVLREITPENFRSVIEKNNHLIKFLNDNSFRGKFLIITISPENTDKFKMENFTKRDGNKFSIPFNEIEKILK